MGPTISLASDPKRHRRRLGDADRKGAQLVNWQGRRVLVTGAGGFIGSHLVESLASAGASVRALVHYNAFGSIGALRFVPDDVMRRIEIVAGDVRDPFAVRGYLRNTEIVFHLAALIGIPYSYIAPSSYVATNVEGTVNVLEGARNA